MLNVRMLSSQIFPVALYMTTPPPPKVLNIFLFHKTPAINAINTITLKITILSKKCEIYINIFNVKNEEKNYHTLFKWVVMSIFCGLWYHINAGPL